MGEKLNLQHKTSGFCLAFKGDSVLSGQATGAGDGNYTIAGYASTFGPPPDLGGDVIEKGAYRQSLIERPNVPICWQHDLHEVIGKTVFMTENDTGLLFKALIVPTRQGKDARVLVENGCINGLSIGYDCTWQTGRGNVKRVLTKIDLYEVSLVTYGMNVSARLFPSETDLQTLKDELLIAEVSHEQAHGIPVSQYKMLRCIEAHGRDLERLRYGKTVRQILYDVLFEQQELEKMR